LLVVLGIAALLFLFRIRTPSWEGRTPQYLFDECYTAFAAHRVAAGDSVVFERAARRFEYLRGGGADLSPASRGEWSHPPGAPLVMAGAVLLFGFREITVRCVSALAALATLAGLGCFAGRKRAWCAAALLALDGSFFVFARTAMPHMLMVAGIMLGTAALARGLRGSMAPWAALAGALFGFAISVRWTAIPIACAVSLVAFVIARHRLRPGVMIAPALGIAAAMGVYLATFAPYLAHGHGWSDLIALHRQMLWFHGHLPAHYGQATPWYAWPWEASGVLFVTRPAPSGVVAVLCVGSPLLGWALLPATLRAAWLAIVRGGATRSLGVTAVAAAWLPWAFLGRFGLSYYLLPALPFVALFVVDLVISLRRRWALPAYVAAAALLLVVMYPVLAAVPLPSRVERAYAKALL
jgi:4-amino-4-deoxy-L-arabinose transferase-like glycosyltransferase